MAIKPHIRVFDVMEEVPGVERAVDNLNFASIKLVLYPMVLHRVETTYSVWDPYLLQL